MNQRYFVFDVESTSLHGEGFAAGAIVCAPFYIQNFYHRIEIIDSFSLVSTEGMKNANKWVKKNVIPQLLSMPKCKTNKELRDKFYQFFMKYKECDIYSDVNFPVETNFLSQIARDDLKNREFDMPYPLSDVSHYIDISIDRLKKYKQLRTSERQDEDTLKIHNPVSDSIISACLLLNHFYYKK